MSIVTILLFCLSTNLQIAEKPRNSIDVNCGSYCLYISLKSINSYNESYSELSTSLGMPGIEGYSMLQLKRQAETVGVNALAVDTNINNLIKRFDFEDDIAIALMKNDHFVVLYKIANDTAFVVDAPNSYRVPLSTFDQQWTGKVLLISKGVILPEEKIESTARIAYYSKITAVVFVSCFVLFIIAKFLLRFNGKFEKPNYLILLFAEAVFLSSFSACSPHNAENEHAASQRKLKTSIVVSPTSHKIGNVVVTGNEDHLLKTIVTSNGDADES